jgi:transglutaminase-like putative cysteine protease
MDARTGKGVNEPRKLSPSMKAVAVPAAVALGAVGAIAAERVNLPPLLGFAGGALAAVLTVLALPSLPTRRATIVLLGIGGLGAVRHASYAGRDRSLLLAMWAVATLVALVLVDRADAESAPVMRGAQLNRNTARDALRTCAVIGLVVIVAAVVLVPTVTERLGRRVWPGLVPSFADVRDAPTSLRDSEQLDMTTRPRLSDKVVFTVDSPRADFWRGETFDVWDGQSWTRSDEHQGGSLERDAANNVLVPPAVGDTGAVVGNDLRQTFHIESGFSDVVFAAPSARLIDTDKLLHGRPDGTVVVAGGASNGFGKGAVYTVTSRMLLTNRADLESADANPTEPAITAQYGQTPENTTDRVRALARQITEGLHTTLDKTMAFEAWLGAHTRYSLDAPLSPPDVDVVDDFLFHTHLGWCEQIASSLVVLARSVGIPARLATGFVPGERDRLTGRFVVRERDAHAWAEIYFPGIGWQGFDPTASVPLAGEARTGGSWLATLRRHAVPFGVTIALVLFAVAVVPELVVAARRRRARRASWGGRTLDRLERAGRKAGRMRAPAETPREYAQVLARHLHAPALEQVGDVLDAEAFGPHGAGDQARAAAEAVVSSLGP